MNIEEKLQSLNLEYTFQDHPPFDTIEIAQSFKRTQVGIGTKSLFLKDKQKNYYVVTMEENKKADLKMIAEELDCSRLSFADESLLEELLHIHAGGVTPMAVLYDEDNKVTIVNDKDLIHDRIFVHPDVNTRTLSIPYENFLIYMESVHHPVKEIKI